VQVQFQVPLGTDVAQVRELLQALYVAHESVLAEPAPSVYIDSIVGGMVAINSFAYVSSPRLAYATRSDIFFRLLKALDDAHIALATPHDVRIIGPASEPPAMQAERAWVQQDTDPA
jgi:small-conductance mechanosensitive channel